MKLVITLTILFLCSCANPESPNDLGLVEILPKGSYIIQNYGSRHIVKCTRPDGKYYFLNDAHFDENHISGHDAHQYRNPIKLEIP